MEPMGPFLDLVLRRNQAPAGDTMKDACRKPKTAEKKKVKNISSGIMGEKLGRIHMKKQNLDKMDTRRMKVLRDRNPKVSSNSSSTTDGSGSGGKKRSSDGESPAASKRSKST